MFWTNCQVFKGFMYQPVEWTRAIVVLLCVISFINYQHMALLLTKKGDGWKLDI